MKPRAHKHGGGDGHLPHARAALGPLITDDQHAARLHFGLEEVFHHILLRLKDHRGPPVIEHIGVNAALLHHGALGGQIAVEHRKTAVGMEGVLRSVNDFGIDRPVEIVQKLSHAAVKGHGHVQLQLLPDTQQRRGHASRPVVVPQVIFGGGLELCHHGNALLNGVKFLQIQFHSRHLGNGHGVHHKIGGAAGGRGVADAVGERGFGQKTPGGDPLFRQLHDLFAHVPGLAHLGGGAVEHGGGADGTQPQHLGKDAHGVGRAVHGAGTAGKANIFPIVLKLLPGQLARVPRADGLLQIGGGQHLVPVVIGHHGAGGEKQCRHIDGGRRHEHSGDDFVAGTQKHQSVKVVGLCHGLNGGGDQIPLGQDVLHPQKLGHAVTGAGNGKLRGRAACGPDALLHIACQLPEGLVAGVDVVPGVHNTDDLFLQILLPVAHRAHQPVVVGVFGVSDLLSVLHGRPLLLLLKGYQKFPQKESGYFSHAPNFCIKKRPADWPGA